MSFRKIKENELDKVYDSQELLYDWFMKEKNITKSVSDCLKNIVEEKIRYEVNYFHKCESPIEQMMCLEFMNLNGAVNEIYSCKNREVFSFMWEPQAEIISSKINFRVDFLLELIVQEGIDIETQNPNLEKHKIIIECDGYEFHYKDQKLTNKTLKRDRELKTLGYEILHFSGSEILSSSQECYDFIVSYIGTCVRGPSKSEYHIEG